MRSPSATLATTTRARRSRASSGPSRSRTTNQTAARNNAYQLTKKPRPPERGVRRSYTSQVRQNAPNAHPSSSIASEPWNSRTAMRSSTAGSAGTSTNPSSLRNSSVVLVMAVPSDLRRRAGAGTGDDRGGDRVDDEREDEQREAGGHQCTD